MTSSSRDLEVLGKPGAMFSCRSESSEHWVVSRKTQSHPNFREARGIGETRDIKFWDQFDEYNSHSPRYVMQVPEKIKTIAWKNTSQNSSSAKTLRSKI